MSKPDRLEKINDISLAMIAGNMMALLDGKQISADKKKIITRAVDYLESAKRGLRVGTYNFNESVNMLNMREDMFTYEEVLKIEPKHSVNNVLEIIGSLDNLIATIRACKNPNVDIPEKLKSEAINFYKSMNEYYLAKANPIPAL